MIKTTDYRDDDGKGFVIIIKHDKILYNSTFYNHRVASRQLESNQVEEVQTKDE